MLSYLKQTIESIAERDFAQIGQDKTVADAAKTMRDKDSTSILVTKKDSSEPVGIITEEIFCIAYWHRVRFLLLPH